MRPPLLFIPGPVPIHPSVLEEMAKPALPHYGPAWGKAYKEVLGLLRYVWAAPPRSGPVPSHRGLSRELPLGPGTRPPGTADGAPEARKGGRGRPQRDVDGRDESPRRKR